MKEKTILLGKVDETVYTLTLKDGTVIQNGYKDVFNYDQGVEKAKEYLKTDDFYWKEAVASDRTTKGLDEYNEEIIDMDGWEQILGEDNVQEIDYSGYYVETHNLIEDEGLPYDEYEYYDDIFLFNKEDFKKLAKAIEENNIEKIEEIFKECPEFNARENLKYYD